MQLARILGTGQNFRNPQGWRVNMKHHQQVALFLVAMGVAVFVLITHGNATEVPPHKTADVNPKLISQHGHMPIVDAVFCRDGRFVLTAGGDGTARLWTSDTAVDLRVFRGHKGGVLAVAASPDGRHVLTGGEDHTARLWDMSSGQELSIFTEHKFDVDHVAFSSDGRFMLTQSKDHLAVIRDTASGRPVRNLQINACAFSPDGKALVLAYGHYLVIEEVETGHVIKRWALPRYKIPAVNFVTVPFIITAVALTGDGRWVVIGDETGQVWCGSITGDNELRLLGRHSVHTPPGVGHIMDTSGYVTSVTFLPGTPIAVTGGWDRTIRFWDVQKKSAVSEIRHSSFGQISSLAVHPNGGTILFTDSSTAQLLRTQSQLITQQFKRNVFYPSKLLTSRDGRVIVTSVFGIDNTIAIVWDMERGQEVLRVRDAGSNYAPALSPFALSPDGRHCISATKDGARLWDTRTGVEIWPLSHSGHVTSAVFSQDKRFIFTGTEDGMACQWQVDTGKQIRCIKAHESAVTAMATYPHNDLVLTASDDKTMRVWSTTKWNEIWRFKSEKVHTAELSITMAPNGVALSNNGLFVTTGRETPTLRNASTGEEIARLSGPDYYIVYAVFSPDDQMILTVSSDGVARLWEVPSGRLLQSFEAEIGLIGTAVFLQSSNFILNSGENGIQVWNRRTAKLVATLSSFEGGWSVVNPDGHFDTGNLDEIKGLLWVFPDDPFRALPPELYMRDYYEPKLLPRLLFEKKNEFKKVRPLQSLNRAQPQVKGIRLSPGEEPGTVTAEVDVEGGSYRFEQTGEMKVTGAYDLRLFRDGQLVGQYPESKESTPDGFSGPGLEQWRNDTRVVEARDKKTVPFPGIKLPRRPGPQPVVEFTAYAFNEDRVKSETAKVTIKPAPGKAARKAYLVVVGVDDYGGSGWDLRYAAKDAHRMAEVLGPRLKQAGYTPEFMMLVSDETQEQATKDKIRAAIESLAGRSTPDDIVVLFFSGHGYSGEHSAFYLLPSDSQPGRESWAHPSPKALGRGISAEELSRWFRKVDAAEMVLIIDACHSAASIESEGFKPGPLGSKGLGQLAYDKRMRVLAASQSDQAAREMGGQISEGVLTYTLLHDGLEANQAADTKGDITLKSWLEYPMKRVPQLFEEIRAGKVNDFGVPVTRDAVSAADLGGIQREGAVQVPALFDFTRTGGVDVILGRTIQTGKSAGPLVKP